MGLRLEDRWVWDFWFAHADGRVHVFYLQAPRSLGDPDLRHWNATIGHAVSDDLVSWDVLPDALGPGPAGAWDDKATWTGSVLRWRERWWMAYTGIGAAEDGRVQRIGMAVSDDLATWEKVGDGPVLTADPRWYEQLDLSTWIEETFRDPWLFTDPDGDGVRMLMTARTAVGPPDGRGVIGHARSRDMVAWEPLPPVSQPGDFAHLEVPQLVAIDGRWYLLFCVYEWAHSSGRLERARACSGTHYLVGDGPLGPFRSPGDAFLCASDEGPAPFYAGKLVQDPRDSAWCFASWVQFDDGGTFVGELADPVPVAVHGDGTLSLPAPPRLRR